MRRRLHTLGPCLALLPLLSCSKATQGGTASPADANPGALTGASATDARGGEAERGQAEAGAAAVEEPVEPPGPPPLPDDYLRFGAACSKGERVTLGAVGDVLLHRELQRHAAEDPRRFRAIWADVADLLAAADLTYANLEGPLAPGLDRDAQPVPDPGLAYDGVVYTGYPRFNYHPSVAIDLRRDGVDVVSTANNHALDRGSPGVDLTIDALRKAGLRYTGTRASDRLDAPWHTETKAGPLTVAWLACTRHVNQHADDLHQVLRCDRDRREMKRIIGALRQRDDIDAVIVLPHIGKQYVAEPSERDREWVHDWLEAGALAVIGNHPHVVRPWEKYVTKDGRETFAIYSLGNFVSHQPELPRRTTAVLYLGLVRGEDGETRVAGVRYAPVHVEREGDRFFARPVDEGAGPADSRAHLVQLLGAPNLIEPAEVSEKVRAKAEAPVDVAPHCDPAWRPEISPPVPATSSEAAVPDAPPAR